MQIKREIMIANRDPSTCFYCRERGHKIRDCMNAPVCSRCSRKGHDANNCRASDALSNRVGVTRFFFFRVDGRVPPPLSNEEQRFPRNNAGNLNRGNRM